MRIHRDERGQTIILVALSLPLLLGFIGIATDVGALFKDKRTMQTAADAAAIAGALSLNSGSTAVTAAAKKASAANGYPDASNGVVVKPLNGPTWPASNYLNQPGYIEVTITKPESTIFLSIFGYPSVTVSARAVAAANGPSAACIYTTGGTSIGLTVSNSTVTSTECGLVVDSSNSPPMQVTSGGKPTALSMKSIGTVGDCADSCGTGSITPTPVPGIIPYSDPLSSLPQFTCNGGSCTNGTTTLACFPDPNVNTSNRFTLNPGCYNGLSINGSGLIFFNPGTYVINGPINFNGTNILLGTGVTFYMNSGTININNSTTLNFYAPNSPSETYNGIVFAQNPNSPNQIQTLNIASGSIVQGIIYFPNASLTVTTTSIGITMYAGFVAQSLSFVGSLVPGNVTLNDYASLPGIISPLSSVVLVE